MKFYLETAIFTNRAPFKKVKFTFFENEVAVLSGVNGKGKTTIISHIIDALYEIAKSHFTDISEDTTAYYRVSSALFSLRSDEPSLVYLRFRLDGRTIDYIDIRKPCDKSQYEAAADLDNPIGFGKIEQALRENDNSKIISDKLTPAEVKQIFTTNVVAYFPSYRSELPSYINPPHKRKLEFARDARFAGKLNKPLEVVSSLSDVSNWLMDVLLDLQYPQTNVRLLFNSANTVLTYALSAKQHGVLRFGAGQRNRGAARLAIVDALSGSTLYPTIFSLSAGEAALLCIFCEILRHADINEMSGIL